MNRVANQNLDAGNPSLDDLQGSLEEKCQTFAYILGLEEPVPEAVLVAALEDPAYARRLLQNRDRPEFLYDLLNNPPQRLSGKPVFSNKELMLRAGKSILRWSLSGFPTVSKKTLQQREDACLACPNLVEPTKTLQRMTAPSQTTNVTGGRTGNKTCSVCGCVIRNKIRVATDTCPVEAEGTPGTNKWGEPMQA